MIGIIPWTLGLLTLACGIGSVGADNAVYMLRAGDCDADVKVMAVPAGGTFMMCSAGGDKDMKVVVDEKVFAEGPAAWIGVRLAPVPEPLAAHIGRGGLMIANVVVDSPADAAGLERYDVVVSFNGQPIGELSDLHAAISDNGADETARLAIIHAGEQETLRITPIERGARGAMEFKYDEPEVAATETQDYFFGGRMRSLPGQRWVFEPHGRLDNLPDYVMEFLDPDDMPDMDWEDWAEQLPDWVEDWTDMSKRQWRFHNLPFGVEIEIDDDDSRPQMKWFGGWGDAGAESEMTIEIAEDGKSIEIHRSKDGQIEVERIGPDGEHSSSTYEAPEELQQADEEAYKIYIHHLGPRGNSYIWRTPDAKALHEKQKDFQVKLKRHLDKARESHERARDVQKQYRKKVERSHDNSFVWKQKVERDDDGGSHRMMTITIDDDGQIKVDVFENGEHKTYEFDSREDFEAAEPELFERVREHLE